MTDPSLNQLQRCIPVVAVVFSVAAWLAGCGQSREASGSVRDPDRAALLGRAEDWGLLGLDLEGGPLSYRRASDLEAPTWAPPELGVVEGAWLTDNAIWARFADSRIGRYEYKTGRLVYFGAVEAADFVLPLPGLEALLVADPGGTARLVGDGADWRMELGGRPVRFEPVGGDRAVAWVTTDSAMELLVLAPPQKEPVARRALGPIRDLVVPAASDRLFYLPVGGDRPELRSVTLAGLEDAASIELEDPGELVAATPSGHRLYVTVGRRLHVFSSISGKKIRSLELPAAVSDLRFAVNGAALLARLVDSDDIAVLWVGVDATLGEIPARWQHGLPIAVPGGVVTGSEDGLALYHLPELREVARAPLERTRLWFPVEWQPPRPRPELATVDQPEGASSPGDRAPPMPADSGDVDYTAPGFYAVVLAARNREGVDEIVGWLRSVDYPAAVNRHEDVMGQVWYRALVGPYAGRGSAERAAEELNTRYGYKPWILAVERIEETSAPTDSTPEAPAIPEESEERGPVGEDAGASGGRWDG